jgi:hypothetical protein
MVSTAGLYPVDAVLVRKRVLRVEAEVGDEEVIVCEKEGEGDCNEGMKE